MSRFAHLVTLGGALSLGITLMTPVMAARTTPTPADVACETILPPPAPSQDLAPQQQAEVDALLSAMPLEVKIGQMLMAGVTGTSTDAAAMIEDLHIGNIILMSRNIENPAQVRTPRWPPSAST